MKKIIAYVILKEDQTIITDKDHLSQCQENCKGSYSYFGIDLNQLFDIITSTGKWEKGKGYLFASPKISLSVLKIFFKHYSEKDETDLLPQKDPKEDFVSSNNGKYMVVITKNRIFIVSRKGRKLNKYGVQYCLSDQYLKYVWNKSLSSNNIEWFEGIDRRKYPSLYETWKNKFKNIHILEANYAMQS